jgi:glycosyltransferase involved in cell wall biosynthesis
VQWEAGPLPSRLSDSLTREGVRDLLGSADAFVLPTRGTSCCVHSTIIVCPKYLCACASGEGWGLPVAEAMAMSLPVIVTNYSGPAAYCDASNAYLLSVEEGLDELSFCRPDGEHLTRLMRQVVRESGMEGVSCYFSAISVVTCMLCR